jgi:hypothetical protein
VPNEFEFLQDDLVILLASRFSTLQDGHFFWYTKELATLLQQIHPNYLIISPHLKDDKVPDFIDSRWLFVKDLNKWGNDFGKDSPQSLVKLLAPILQRLNQDQGIFIFSFESSFSMCAALLEIQRIFPQIRVGITLLDHGFWLKMFTSRPILFDFLTKKFIRILQINAENFKLFHPSIAQVSQFRQLIGVDVFPVRQMSAFWNHPNSISPTFSESLKLLVLPWPKDVDRILQFVNSFSNLLGTKIDLHVHFKSQSDFNYFNLNAQKDHLNLLNVSIGSLKSEDYVLQYRQSDAVWIPYTDEYHQVTGSGRALDSVVLGCPLIIDKGSDLALIAPDLPLVYFSDNSELDTVVECLNDLANLKKDYTNYLQNRKNLQTVSSMLFTPLNTLESFIIPFSSENHENDYKKRKFTKIDFYSLQLLYYIFQCYSRLTKGIKAFCSISSP